MLLPRTSFSFEPTNAAAALIVVDDEKLLLQHRDHIEGIIYPGYWGCFGGALDGDESPVAALRRELKEELNLDAGEPSYFTAVNYDFRFCGKGTTLREYYVVPIAAVDVGRLVLGEGQGMATFSPQEIFSLREVIPFDLFAIWLYANRAVLAR